MKPRHKRLTLALLGLSGLGLAAWFVLSAFQQNLVFFFTPTQIQAGEAPSQRSFRVGGMVEAGSHRREADGITHSFVVTDTAQRVRVSYQGLLPDLFQEGKGVVAQGRLQAQASGGPLFVADEVLAKHDENYMPPEAAYALEQGQAARQNGPSNPTPADLVRQGGQP